MKHALIFALSLFFFTSANAQFRMVGTGSWTTVNDSTYSSTLTFNADLTGNGYLATQILQDSFRVFTGLQKIYRIDTVYAQSFSGATVVIVEYGGTQGAPSGQVMVYNPNGLLTVPQCPIGSTGSTAQLQAAVVTYNAANGGSGSSITTGDKGDIDVVGADSDWRVDTLSITWLKLSQAVKDSIQKANDLSYTQSTRVLAITTGADVTLPLATNALPGIMPALGGLGAPGGGVDPVNDVLALGDNSSGAVAGPTVNAVIQAATLGTGQVTSTSILDATILWADLAQAVKDSINSGITSYNFTDTGHGYVSGDVGKMGYLNASGFQLAKSDYGVADSVAQYFIVSVPDVNTIKIATNGRVAKTHAFAVGSYLYLSTTPGEYTDTQPTATNAQYVGRVPADDVIDVLIDDLSNAQVPQSSESLVQINAQTGTTYTLVAGDIGKLITMTNASANTLTIPPNASVAFEVGAKINIAQFGSGQTTIAPGSGVTINSADSANKTRVTYSTCSLIKTATDTWLLAGDITI